MASFECLFQTVEQIQHLRLKSDRAGPQKKSKVSLNTKEDQGIDV